MALNLKLARDMIKQKLSQNPALLKELGLNNLQDLSTLDDRRLELLLTPKNLGLLSLDKKDLEL